MFNQLISKENGKLDVVTIIVPRGGSMHEKNELHRQIQECIQRIPVIVLGSGASVPHGIPGMWSLGQHLTKSQLPECCATEAHQKCWGEFLKLIETEDLESALSRITATEEVTEHIVNSTWKFLNMADINVYHQIIADRQSLPLSRLFRFLFRSTAQEINVVTPNYDRLAEYAAEAAGYCAFTGFSFGYLGERAQNPPQRIMAGPRRVRTVNVWKVHGSFGWFRDAAGLVVALPPMTESPPGLTPVIVTPGTEKYRRTHDEPFRTAMQNADEATQRASAFLCIGYGFNDTHLQPRLLERCQSQDVPLVLITKAISRTAREFLQSGRCRRYFALEECKDGTRYFSNEIPGGLEVQGPPYWQLEHFISIFE